MEVQSVGEVISTKKSLFISLNNDWPSFLLSSFNRVFIQMKIKDIKLQELTKIHWGDLSRIIQRLERYTEDSNVEEVEERE